VHLRLELALFARQVGGDGVEVSVAQLGLAKGGHDGDAVPDRVLDEVGCQVGSLFEEGGKAPLYLAARARVPGLSGLGP